MTRSDFIFITLYGNNIFFQILLPAGYIFLPLFVFFNSLAKSSFYKKKILPETILSKPRYHHQNHKFFNSRKFLTFCCHCLLSRLELSKNIFEYLRACCSNSIISLFLRNILIFFSVS